MVKNGAMVFLGLAFVVVFVFFDVFGLWLEAKVLTFHQVRRAERYRAQSKLPHPIFLTTADAAPRSKSTKLWAIDWSIWSIFIWIANHKNDLFKDSPFSRALKNCLLLFCHCWLCHICGAGAGAEQVQEGLWPRRVTWSWVMSPWELISCGQKKV